MQNLVVLFLAGTALLWFSVYFDWVHMLKVVGFPADKLYHPRVQADLAIFRTVAFFIAILSMLSGVAVWKNRDWIARLSKRAEAVLSSVAQSPLFVPLLLTTLVLVKTVLQLGVYFAGYMAYAADDFGRPLKADYWLQFKRFDLGKEGWLDLGLSGWLPFPDYLFGLALALNRDLYLTPKIVNLALSGIAVIAVYYLGRELFGRTAGLLTATLFALQPWHLWLGISGMTSDLPSVVIITVFALFLFRWVETERPHSLLAAAGCLFAANGFRYENWLFSVVFSLFIVFRAVLYWRSGQLSRRWLTLAFLALAVANAFPVVWMAASYYFLGDWLPALHKVPAAYKNVADSMGGIHVLALSSFPLEMALSIAGVILFLKAERRKSIVTYLIFSFAAFLLFLIMGAKGGLSRIGPTHGRILLPYLVLLLPFAGFLLNRFLRHSGARRIEYVIFGCLLLVVIGFFDILRAFNFPASFPRDAIQAGWLIRGLQETASIPVNGKILIEKGEDWGEYAIVALANRPERFVLFDGFLLGNACEKLQTEACRGSIDQAGFDLVIFSSPERALNFRRTFSGRWWHVGRYHIFDMNSFAG
jgi:Dolichyl-phosphate-mannose-protein mannosyltransferase